MSLKQAAMRIGTIIYTWNTTATTCSSISFTSTERMKMIVLLSRNISKRLLNCRTNKEQSLYLLVGVYVLNNTEKKAHFKNTNHHTPKNPKNRRNRKNI